MTKPSERVAVVVPAFNEERLIGTTLTTVPEFVEWIIVVDDASTDDTLGEIGRIDDPRIVVVSHSTNTGVGGAVLDGHRKALDLGASISVVMAGDAQMPPEYLEDLLAPIIANEADFTKGNRFDPDADVTNMPALRRVGSVVLSVLTKAASGYWSLFDAQNGYTAIHRRVLERMPLEDISIGYSFENSMLIHANIVGARAVDVAIPARYGEEVSGMRLTRVGPQILGALFVGYWTRIWRKYVVRRPSPISLLAYASVLMMTIGAIVGGFAVVNSIGTPQASAGTVVFAAGSVIVGIQLGLASLLLDYLESRRHDP